MHKYRWVRQLETWINRFLHIIFVTRGSLQKRNKKEYLKFFRQHWSTQQD
jgi:hypothetical protein